MEDNSFAQAFGNKSPFGQGMFINADEPMWEALIGKIIDGDIIEIDIPNRSINVKLSDEQLAARKQRPLTRDRKVSKALRAYAQSVSSADKGGVRVIND